MLEIFSSFTFYLDLIQLAANFVAGLKKKAAGFHRQLYKQIINLLYFVD